MVLSTVVVTVVLVTDAPVGEIGVSPILLRVGVTEVFEILATLYEYTG